MKSKLDLLMEGYRDGLNGWVNKKRTQTDFAYKAGVAIGEYRYQQFLSGLINPPRGYVFPEPPAELYAPLIELLSLDSDNSDLRSKKSRSKLMQPSRLIRANSKRHLPHFGRLTSHMRLSR